MAQPPIQPTTLDKIIRAVSTVKTRGALSALTLILLFFCFWLALVFTTDKLQWVLSVLIIVSMVGFAIYSLKMTKQDSEDKT